MQTTEPSQSAWPRMCGCGESWGENEWVELPTSGHYDAGSDGWIEFRTCVCGATLSMSCVPPGHHVSPPESAHRVPSTAREVGGH